MSDGVESRLRWYQATAIFSVLFALLGFTYNAWRLQESEINSNQREAAFEILLQLAELEQLVYAAHYDDDDVDGNPRVGWVKVGLLVDLGQASSAAVHDSALALKATWTDHWSSMPDERASADAIVVSIDAVRAEVQALLASLQ